MPATWNRCEPRAPQRARRWPPITTRLARITVLVLPLALATPDLHEPMRLGIHHGNHTNTVISMGRITPDTPAAFQASLDTEPCGGFHFEIALNSSGRGTRAALELGRMIHDWRLVTRFEIG